MNLNSDIGGLRGASGGSLKSRSRERLPPLLLGMNGGCCVQDVPDTWFHCCSRKTCDLGLPNPQQYRATHQNRPIGYERPERPARQTWFPDHSTFPLYHRCQQILSTRHVGEEIVASNDGDSNSSNIIHAASSALCSGQIAEELKVQVSLLEGENACLHQRTRNLHERLEEIEADKNSILHHATVLETHCDGLQRQVNNLREDRYSLQQRIEDLQADRVRLDFHISNLKNRLCILENVTRKRRRDSDGNDTLSEHGRSKHRREASYNPKWYGARCEVASGINVEHRSRPQDPPRRDGRIVMGLSTSSPHLRQRAFYPPLDESLYDVLTEVAEPVCNTDSLHPTPLGLPVAHNDVGKLLNLAEKSNSRNGHSAASQVTPRDRIYTTKLSPLTHYNVLVPAGGLNGSPAYITAEPSDWQSSIFQTPGPVSQEQRKQAANRYRCSFPTGSWQRSSTTIEGDGSPIRRTIRVRRTDSPTQELDISEVQESPSFISRSESTIPVSGAARSLSSPQDVADSREDFPSPKFYPTSLSLVLPRKDLASKQDGDSTWVRSLRVRNEEEIGASEDNPIVIESDSEEHGGLSDLIANTHETLHFVEGIKDELEIVWPPHKFLRFRPRDTDRVGNLQCPPRTHSTISCAFAPRYVDPHQSYITTNSQVDRGVPCPTVYNPPLANSLPMPLDEPHVRD